MNSKLKELLTISLVVGIVFIALLFSVEEVEASKALSLVINGQDLTYKASPIIENGRTLVALRLVSEELGAKVTWNGQDSTVLIEKDGKSILMKIGSRLISYNDGQDYELSDVEPKLINKDGGANASTYVPLRLISNALDIGVAWDGQERTVYINSEEAPDKEAISGLKIISQKPNEIIKGKTSIQIQTDKEYKEGSYIQFLLLEKGETSGFIIEKGKDIGGKYTYTPKIEDNGKKVLIAAVYDKNGNYLDGHAIAIEIKVDPQVSLLGVTEKDVIKDSVNLSTKTNFLPLYVKYEIKKLGELDLDEGFLTELKDPLGTFKWDPKMKENGLYSLRAVAYDYKKNPYYSESVIVEVDNERMLSLGGVKEGMLINNGVYLLANRNFDVSETEFLMRDLDTGRESTIAKIPYGGYMWNPKSEDTGAKELFVRVMSQNKYYTSDPVRVKVDGSAKLFLKGIGPDQVINKEVSLNVESNVDLENVRYFITNLSNNEKRELTQKGENNEVIYRPLASDKDHMMLEAQADYKDGTISSDKIKIKVYHGEFFGPQAIVAKDEFMALASKLSLNSYDETGMSAALQTAQAILETGWGQSVPVDKYTGKLSNNLFGIKGTTELGSVTSNTWEVYNGQSYRVDANFRAYKDVDSSWKDHKSFLLAGERYKPFTQVMFDYTKAAWALKRAGYATDPEYALKLINIIESYKLYELDKIGI